MPRKATGRLFLRGKNYYLTRTLNGKRITEVLRDEIGNPITTLREAEKVRNRLMAPLAAADALQRQEMVLFAVQSEKRRLADVTEALIPPLAIEKVWETYSHSPAKHDCTSQTEDHYLSYWSAFVKWLHSSHPEIIFFRNLNEAVGAEYGSALLARKVSAGTFNKHITFLKSLCEILKKEGKFESNPFSVIRKKKHQSMRKRELTLEELKRILDESSGELHLLFAIGIFTGLRLGDCCTLRWNEVDLIRRIIRRVPNKTASNRPEPVIIGIPGYLLERFSSIPLHERQHYILPGFATRYQKRHLQPDISKEISVFFEGIGTQTHKSGTGINGIRAVVEVGFHSLRHSYVSLCAMSGVSQAVIQANVGHSNPSMTAHYTHVSLEAARDTADLFSKSLGAPLSDTERLRQKLLDYIANASSVELQKAAASLIGQKK